MGIRWFDGLEESDRGFVKRFVLASGSLKEMARSYGVSYPTVRSRLDRLIATIQVLDDETTVSELERLVRKLVAEGRLDAATGKRLLDLHRAESGGNVVAEGNGGAEQ